jgi:phospholipid/cholesterol/gamma-HCH transport system permease protein
MAEAPRNALVRQATGMTEALGRGTVGAVEMVGHWAVLAGESLYWLFVGPKLNQPLRLSAVVAQCMEIGVRALPILTLLSATIGIMLAIQGIYTLRIFGAQSQVVLGMSLSIVREFAPLITGVLVAGRSGSALAARLSTMQINQEIDALRVMGINPVRFLVLPALVAMVIMLPALTFVSDVVGLGAGGLYVTADLGISQAAYWHQVIDYGRIHDLWHGLSKASIFAVLITLIGVANGASVSGGAEGVGRVTTRSVVQSISAIVITDMLFVFVVTHT